MRNFINIIKYSERSRLIFAAIILLCALCIALFLNRYFGTYQQPYMMDEIIDLSQGWHYRTNDTSDVRLDSLRTGPKLVGGKTMTMYRKLEREIEGAAILIRANHQTVNVYLDEETLYLDQGVAPEENPGMALHLIPLPEDYIHKTLILEITSPYTLYAGRTSPILLGTPWSLETYTLSVSMRSFILMSMCLLIGFGIISLTFVQAVKDSRRPQDLAIGVFAVIWALYYVCTEYIVFQFFSPFWVSTLSLGLYFTFQAPLTLYFYFSFIHYKKQMLPVVLLHNGFAVGSILLQVFGLVDLPRLVSINNLLLAGLAYTIALTILEAKKGNRSMGLAVPFFLIAYVSMLYNFYVFYTRHGTPPYTYRDTYLLLLLCILLYNLRHFFNGYYKRQRESEVLTLQNRLAKESYEKIKTHLREVGALKHEIKNHLTAMQTYLKDGRYEEAESYLEMYAGQAKVVTDAVYHSHFLINAMVGHLLQETRNKNIRVDLNLKPGPVHISDPDLYSLLSNILGNALEACTSVPVERERFIKLTIARREPYLYITCQNSRVGELIHMDGKLQTNKKESGHGYGVWIVEKIADTYDGFVDTDFDQQTFTITVALKDS